MALLESVGDPTLTVGLSFAPIYAKAESAEMCEALRWSQRVIDLADGDPSKGNFIMGSPLAVALMQRAIARWCLGLSGWRDDQRHGLAMARSADPLTYAGVVGYVYFLGISCGVLSPDYRACARSRMRYGLRNDPVMTSRWPGPAGAGRCAGAPPHGCGA